MKWGKQKFTDVDLSTDEAPDVFKLQLYSLTNVLPERQKIMLKGMTVKDDWTTVKLKNVSMYSNNIYLSVHIYNITSIVINAVK